MASNDCESMVDTPLEAVILVGGQGTRLRPVVSDRPKPMAVVAGRPFVENWVMALKTQDVRRIIFSTGYLGDRVNEYFGTGDRWGLEIAYSQETRPLGTGGAVRQAFEHLRGDRGLVLNGDSYCRFDLTALYDIHCHRTAAATLLLAPVDDCSRYGSVIIAPDGAVKAFREKQPDQAPGLVNAGVYILERSAVETMPLGHPRSLETEFFPQLIGHGLYAMAGTSALLDIGTPAAYASAAAFLTVENGV